MITKRLLIAGFIGNILEFYDFTLFGAMTLVFSDLFFPETDQYSRILYTFATFSVGFFARPLGAIFFGYVGDYLGRRKALSLSLMMMAYPTLIIALLPSYAYIGLFAPIILALCRFCHGFSASAEYNGTAIFLIEHFGEQHKGMISGLVSMASTLGCVLAMVVSGFCLHPELPDYFWRFAYIIGFSLAFIGYFIRTYIQESPVFVVLRNKNRMPLKEVIQRHKKSLFVSFFLAMVCGTTAALMVAFLPVYLQQIGIHSFQALMFQAFGMMCFVVAAPFWGILADKMGECWVMMRVGVGLSVVAVPLFMLFQYPDTMRILIGLSVLGVLAAGFASPFNSLMYQLFPPHIRFSGVTFSYSLGMALTGGITPFLMMYLMQTYHNPLLPGFYLSSMTAVAVLVLFFNRLRPI